MSDIRDMTCREQVEWMIQCGRCPHSRQRINDPTFNICIKFPESVSKKPCSVTDFVECPLVHRSYIKIEDQGG